MKAIHEAKHNTTMVPTRNLDQFDAVNMVDAMNIMQKGTVNNGGSVRLHKSMGMGATGQKSHYTVDSQPRKTKRKNKSLVPVR